MTAEASILSEVALAFPPQKDRGNWAATADDVCFSRLFSTIDIVTKT